MSGSKKKSYSFSVSVTDCKLTCSFSENSTIIRYIIKKEFFTGDTYLKKKKVLKHIASTSAIATVLLTSAGVAPGVGTLFSQTVLAKEVTKTESTASITNLSSDAYGHRDTFEIATSVKERLAEGDTLTYNLSGLDASALNNRDLVIEDGTVIGRISVSVTTSAGDHLDKLSYSKSLNGQFTKAQEEMKPTDLVQSKVKVTFNKKATEFETLNYKIKADNYRTNNLLSNIEAKQKLTISEGTKELASIDYTKPKEEHKPYTSNKAHLAMSSSLSSITNTEKGLSGGWLSFGAFPARDGGFKKGDKITFTTNRESGFKFDNTNKKFQVGSTFTDTHGRNSTQTFSVLNKNGVFITKQNDITYKVVESTPDKIVLEVLSPNEYNETLDIKVPVKLTSLDNVDVANKKVNNIKIGMSYTSKDTPSKSVSAEDTLSINVNGLNLSSDGLRIQYKKTEWLNVANPTEPLKETYVAEDTKEAGTIDGYEFVRTDVDAKTGNLTHWFQERQEEEVDDAETFTTRWTDDTPYQAKELKASVTGEKAQEAGTIDGYNFVRTETSQDGLTVTHIFTKKTKTIHKDYEDGTILREEEGTTEKSEFPDYHFVETQKSRETGVTTHIYKRNATLHNTDEEKPRTLKIEKGTKDKSEFKGFSYIKTYQKDGNTFHIYHAIVTKHVTVKDGKEFVLKLENGNQPKTTFDGYNFEKTEVKENGDVVHYYTPITTPTKPSETPKETPKTPESKPAVQTGASAGGFILPTIGFTGLSGLVGGLAYLKSKRKK